MPTLGKRIREIRKFSGMTQQELAEKSNLSMMSIRRYENGSRTPNFETLQKIACALNVKFDEILHVNQLPSIFVQFDDGLQTTIDSVYQEHEAYEKYMESMGYKMFYDFRRMDGNVLIIHDLRNDAYYATNNAQLDSLREKIISYTKFQMHEIISGLTKIPGYQEKKFPTKKSGGTDHT